MRADNIGALLREARIQQGLSLRGMAQSLGMSASLVSQVETGKTQPSVSTLYMIVNHLGMSIDELLGVTPDAKPPIEERPPALRPVQRGSENPVLEMENGVRWERLAVGEGDQADGFLVTYEPGASSSVEGRLMRHGGSEHAYLLEGQLTLRIDFDTYVINPGDSLQFNSVHPHLYLNETNSVARGVWFVVGRRQQNQSMPQGAPTGARKNTDGSQRLSSAVDVLRVMDEID